MSLWEQVVPLVLQLAAVVVRAEKGIVRENKVRRDTIHALLLFLAYTCAPSTNRIVVEVQSGNARN